MTVKPGSAAGRLEEEIPVRRGLWLRAVAVIAASLVVVPIADYRLAVHPNLTTVFLVLMAAADLLTAHLLVQQFWRVAGWSRWACRRPTSTPA